MKHPCLVCLFQLFTATLLISQPNSVPFVNSGFSPWGVNGRDFGSPSSAHGALFGGRLPAGGSPRLNPASPGLPFGKRGIGELQSAASFIFQIAPTYGSGGQEALSLAVGDVNGDGKPDLVVANGCATNNCPNGAVSVLLGNGDGTFQAAVAYSSGGNRASSVALADVNADGKLDIVVTNACASGNSYCGGGETGVVAVLLGNGDGTFKPAATYGSGGVDATSVAVADVNRDGKPDLVVANAEDPTYSTGLVSVLLGNGDGTFQAAVSYDSGGYSATSVAVADLIGNGTLDLVVAQCESSVFCIGAVGVLLGNGNGTFQPAVTYSLNGLEPNSVAIGDVNGDGKPDVVVAMESAISNGNGGVGVLLGNGDGTLQTAVIYDSGGFQAQSVAVADVNRDGIPDLLVANCGGSEEACGDGNNAAVGVLLGVGNGTFQTAVTYASGGYDGTSVAVNDVNGDGDPDLLVVNLGACSGIDALCLDGAVSVLLGNGHGTFRAAPIYGSGGSPTFSVATADVNGDGKPDLVTALGCANTGDCADGAVGVRLGNGDGTFQTVVTYGSGGYSARSVAVADVNGDGIPDLVVANECTNDNEPNCTGVIGVLLGNGNGTFQAAVAYGTGGYYADWVAVADVNGDGKPDLLVVNSCTNASCTSSDIAVLLGNGDGTFRPAVVYASGGYGADSLAVADVNGDGKPDLLVANQCAIGSSGCAISGKVGVLLGNGDGTFQAAITYNSGGQFPFSLAVGDVNGDGQPDIVVANACAVSGNCGNGSIVALLGNGEGKFHPAPSAAPNPELFPELGPIVLADFNGDGNLDVASSGGTLWLGKGDGTFKSATSLGLGGFGIAVGDFNLDGRPDLAVGGVAILLNITGAATTTALVSSPNRSRFDQLVTFRATVLSSVGTPTGKVTFMNGATALATKTLSGGAASFATSELPPGLDSITAVYAGGGNSNFGGSTSAPVNQIVLASTTSTLSSSPNPSRYGAAVTFTVVVDSSTGAPPNGEPVLFEQDNEVLGTGKISGGSASFTISTLAAGDHPIIALYGGDLLHAGSKSRTVKQVVNKAVN
jgi:hypothetical protein